MFPFLTYCDVGGERKGAHVALRGQSLSMRFAYVASFRGSDPKAIAFEAENISSMLNCYEPSPRLTGYHSDRDGKWKKFEYMFTEKENDRQLPSHVAKQVLVTHNKKDKPEIIFLWLMTLTVSPIRGQNVRVRIRNSEFQTVDLLRFHWERILLLIFRRLPWVSPRAQMTAMRP